MQFKSRKNFIKMQKDNNYKWLEEQLNGKFTSDNDLFTKYSNKTYDDIPIKAIYEEKLEKELLKKQIRFLEEKISLFEEKIKELSFKLEKLEKENKFYIKKLL